MFDFQNTLDEANEYRKHGNYAIAAFSYWLIGFAYEDEEFPYYYTPAIGAEAYNGYVEIMNNHYDQILKDDSYLIYKSDLIRFSSYRKYFERFELEVTNYVPHSRSHNLAHES